MNVITVDAAARLAIDIFDGVTDKSGQPYAHHIFRVAQYVHALGGDDHAVIAALHHDSVEDLLLTIEDLHGHGFSAESIEAIDSVTRRADPSLASGKEPYQSGLIHRSAGNRRGRLIKLSDNANNSLPRRVARLSGEHANIGDTRYKRARIHLLRVEAAERAAGRSTFSFPLREDDFMRYMVDLDESLGGDQCTLRV